MTRFEFRRLFMAIHILVIAFCDTGSAYTCSLDDFRQSPLYNDNFDLSTLSQSYEGGATVRVRCSVGFRGFFKMICSSEGWTSSSEKCRPSSCGHPGDVPNSDFELIEGTDYVFGSQVQYTCHKGYQMSSFSAIRNCLQGGWDGHLPVCEPIQCESFPVDFKVLVNGDLDQAQSGSVVQFRCGSNDEMIVGPTQIICGDDGKWDSKTKPTCQPIICPIPPLENFMVEGAKNEYRKNEVLRYKCNEKYSTVDGRPSLCGKVGQSAQWIPPPRCELNTCKVSSKNIIGTEYSPSYKIIFKPGEKVTVTCGEKMWVKNMLNQSAELTCQDDGEWDFHHICQRVICLKATDNISSFDSYWNRRDTYFMDETVPYSCNRRYEETSTTATATCTRRGWDPSPLCLKARCNKPSFNNAEITDIFEWEKYNHDNRVKFKCTYDASVKFHVFCSFGDWTGFVPNCKGKPCTADPEITNGVIESDTKTMYEHNDELRIRCDDQSTFKVTCRSGTWDKPNSCKDISCTKPPIINGELTDPKKQRFDHNQTAVVTCSTGPVQRLTIRCDLGNWTPEPHCPVEGECGNPSIDNGVWVKHEDKLHYTCNNGYKLQDNNQKGVASCVEGKWNTLECIAIEKKCKAPPEIKNALIMASSEQEYSSNTVLTLKCREQFTLNGQDTIQCRNGTWLPDPQGISCRGAEATGTEV